ncbi:CoxG family protein [Tardiphaga sp. 866_E4_N2_1]|uniref:CoxG family protein n=1 Tax=unclassified Tardiphaga TaxID=2631404 RepID=UPI003F26A50B
MALTISGQVRLASSREFIWEKLNDAAVLKKAIPGCEELEHTEGGGLRATVKVKIGPVAARFRGTVAFTDIDPPNGYKIVGDGEGGIAGIAKGIALVRLTDVDGGTQLTYDVETHIGGKLAQLGQRLIAGSAKKLIDEFFSNFTNSIKP